MLGSKLAQHLYAQSQCNEPVESLLGTPSKSVQASVESGIASQTTFLNFPMEGFPGDDQKENLPGAETPGNRTTHQPKTTKTNHHLVDPVLTPGHSEQMSDGRGFWCDC